MEKGGDVCHPHQRDVLLLLLLGLPGAGKSSCARRFTARLDVFNYLIVVFDDNLLFEFESSHRPQWKERRGEILCSVRHLIEAWNTDQFNSTSGLPLVCVLDDNFYYRSMRKDYFRLSRNRCIVVSNGPMKMLTHGNEITLRSRRPIRKSFLWRVYTTPVIYLDLNQIALERQRDREINEASETHRLDTVLRALVRNCILSLPLELQARYGKSLNEVRKVTMLQLKPLVDQHINDDAFSLWILGVFKENIQKEIPSIQMCFD
ncbi:hypothetical protein AAHC03_04447 [Spirometra sp. Aus1]